MIWPASSFNKITVLLCSKLIKWEHMEAGRRDRSLLQQAEKEMAQPGPSWCQCPCYSSGYILNLEPWDLLINWKRGGKQRKKSRMTPSVLTWTNEKVSAGQVAQFVGALSWAPEGCRFDPRSGIYGRQLVCFSHRFMFLSLFLSLPLSL